MPSFFRREKKRAFEITIGKSNTLYLLYPDYTVGIGISPIQLFLGNRSWTLTTGRELHPAPEDEPLFYVTPIIIHKKYDLTNSFVSKKGHLILFFSWLTSFFDNSRNSPGLKPSKVNGPYSSRFNFCTGNPTAFNIFLT